MGEWLEWKGGECPVASDQKVDVKFRGGSQSRYNDMAVWYSWRHFDCQADIIAYRLAEPEQIAGTDEAWDERRLGADERYVTHAHIPIPGAFPLQVVIDEFRKDPAFAAEMDKARIDLHAHMMAAPTTREPAPDPLQAHVEMISALTAERDSLRAEVERLNAMVDAMCGLDYERFLELERLRKGREDGKIADADCGLHDRNTLGLQLCNGGTVSLDPRLGMPQPEGEPVGPRPIRRWVPIL